MAGMLIDAVANALLGTTAIRQQPVRRRGASLRQLRQQALAYIDRHLSSAALDVRAVAGHCGVSERYLHAAFASEPMKLGALIRERRLQNCQRDLRAAESRMCSITEIAYRWGFEDSAHFSHCYKARFGRSPREERSLLQRDCG